MTRPRKILETLEQKIVKQPNGKLKIYSLVTLGITRQKQGELNESESLLREALLSAQQILSTAEIDQI